jgi:hypothetical protein
MWRNANPSSGHQCGGRREQPICDDCTALNVVRDGSQHNVLLQFPILAVETFFELAAAFDEF